MRSKKKASKNAKQKKKASKNAIKLDKKCYKMRENGCIFDRILRTLAFFFAKKKVSTKKA
jgi:hypothetical protein